MTKEQQTQAQEEQERERKKDLARRITLGKAGHLWRFEFTYKAEANSVCLHRLTNQTGEEIMKIRETIFSHGFLLPVKDEPGHWRIIQPKNILTVDLWRQGAYFDEI